MSHDPYAIAFALLKNPEDAASIEKGLALFEAETVARPLDAKAWFEFAGAYDFLGRESEALPRYEKALALGYERLPAEDRPRIFIQLGSTLRNLKKYDQAKKILREGLVRFPQVAALKAFLGLAEYSDGNYRGAAKLFLQSGLGSAEDSSMRDYARALANYSNLIDEFPARQRNWMRFFPADGAEPENTPAAVLIENEHAQALAALMDIAYQGSVDHEGETPEQCLAEIRGTLDGKYGPLISSASFATFSESVDGSGKPTVATSASIVTLWKGRPLLAFSMSHPQYRGQGLAGFLIRKSIAALKASGYKEFYLVVTEGNVPAERLYRKLGFELLGPAVPNKGA